jgi:hypothetical protein
MCRKTSDYPKDHPLPIQTAVNTKVIGMLNYEACGKHIEEFLRLAAKLYSSRCLKQKVLL